MIHPKELNDHLAALRASKSDTLPLSPHVVRFMVSPTALLGAELLHDGARGEARAALLANHSVSSVSSG